MVEFPGDLFEHFLDQIPSDMKTRIEELTNGEEAFLHELGVALQARQTQVQQKHLHIPQARRMDLARGKVAAVGLVLAVTVGDAFDHTAGDLTGQGQQTLNSP